MSYTKQPFKVQHTLVVDALSIEDAAITAIERIKEEPPGCGTIHVTDNQGKRSLVLIEDDEEDSGPQEININPRLRR